MAVRLNASGEYYRRTTNLPSSTAFTVMFWAYIVNDSGGTHTFFSLDDTSSFIDCYLNSGSFKLFSSGAGQGNGPAASEDTWYHLAITCSGTGANTCKLFIDGDEEISLNGASFSPGHILFGDFNVSGGGPFDGRLAAVKMWGAALSEADIEAEMPYYSPVRSSNLHAWYPMRDTSEDQDDFSANNYDLTVNGTPSDEDGPPGILFAPAGGIVIPVVVHHRQRNF